MDEPLEEMLRRLRTEHPEIFSADSLLTTGLVSMKYEGSNSGGTQSQSSILDSLSYVGVYTIVDDYLLLDSPRETLVALRHELIRDILGQVDQRELLLSLKTLAIAAESQEQLEHLSREFSSQLSAPSRVRLERVLRESGRVFLCRQQILAAFRTVILDGQHVDVNRMHPLAAAIFLSHSVLDADDILEDPRGSQLGGLPAKLMLHLVANQNFNSKVDIIANFDRAIRLWRDYGPTFASRLGGRQPHEVLTARTGLDIEDMLAVAFGVWSYDLRWDPVNPRPLAPTLHPRTSSGLVAAFMSTMSSQLEVFATELNVGRSNWDFLPFEMRPIIDLEDGWLLVDTSFLMDRVTSGLYYFVFDHFKSIDVSLALEWSKVWGDMVEALVRDNVGPLAQDSQGEIRPVYTEDDLAAAYPKGGGRADILIDFDETVVAFEVVSGHLTINTRLGLNQESFIDDMEKIVYKKLRQLDGTATNVMNEPSVLLGVDSHPRHFQPVVVAAGGFPINFGTTQLIEDYVVKTNLFQQKSVLPVVVIDLSDLEIIEALGEDGESVVSIIRDWKSSAQSQQSLRNWLIRTRGEVRARPRRMDARIHLLTDDFACRLGIDDEVQPS